MKLSFRPIFTFSAVALLSVGLAPGGTPVAARRDPYLQIMAQPTTITSGYPTTLKVTLVNPTSLRLGFFNVLPTEDFAAESGSRGPNEELHLSRYGHSAVGTFRSSAANSVAVMSLVKPGRSVDMKPDFPLGRAYDMSMPGRYTVRLVTQRPLYLISRKTQITVGTGTATIGSHLFLAAFGDGVPGGGVAKSVAVSNRCLLTVTAPYGKPPPAAIEPTTAHILPGPQPHTAQLVAKIISTHGTGMPVLFRVWICTGTKPLSLRLTGNPLVDFRHTKVDGPDGRQGYGLIKGIKPHTGPLPNWKPVPLTAYGKWLIKHDPAVNIKAKTYLLKSRAVYQYAVPVNLSCRFDMSLPGNWGGCYHVRVRLAQSSLSSQWLDVKVRPPNDGLQH
ncbi:MAG: hypothetical protein ACP5O1_12260 [Phycisphaerae bacterium]